MTDRHVRFIARETPQGLVYVIEDIEYAQHGTPHIIADTFGTQNNGRRVLDILATGANILIDTGLRLGVDVIEAGDWLEPATYIECLREAVTLAREVIDEYEEADELVIDERGEAKDIGALRSKCAAYRAIVDKWERVLAKLPRPEKENGNGTAPH